MSSRPTLAALLLAALTSVSAQAASQIEQVALNCSDTLNIEGVSALSLRCAGNFTLSGQGAHGTISADESLSIWAAGSLVFEDVSLNAPLITLTSDTRVSIDSATLLNGGSVTIQGGGDVREIGAGIGGGGSVSLSGGSNLGIDSPSPVPEPSTALLSLTAVALFGLGRLARSRSR